MKPRQKRFMFIAVGIAAVSLAVGLVLYALRGNVNLYFTPTQVSNNEVPQGAVSVSAGWSRKEA